MNQRTRIEKQKRFGQRACALWLFGLSGAGKTTLAEALEEHLVNAGFITALLDGDHVRAGLNHDLGFSDADRTENLRRAAEVARLYVQSGFVTICSFITPLKSQRALAQEIIGSADFIDIYVEASYLTCARRDPKGLYKRASANQLAQFTGKDSLFEPPDKKDCRFIVNTEAESVDVSVSRLRDFVIPHLRLPKPTITSVSFSLETPHRGA